MAPECSLISRLAAKTGRGFGLLGAGIALAFVLITSPGEALGLAAGRTIRVSSSSELASAVNNAQEHDTILLAEGTYSLSGMLWVGVNSLTICGESGNRERVIVQGNGMTGSVSHVFNVNGHNFTVKNLTMGRVAKDL